MDEDLEMEEQNAGGGMSLDAMRLAGPNSATAAALLAKYERMETGIAAEREVVAKRGREMYEAGKADIMAKRYGAPTTREQLFALSAALASPRYYGGIAGTLSRVAPALGQMSQLQGSAENQRSEALNQLRQQYEGGAATSRLAGLESERTAFRGMVPAVMRAETDARRAAAARLATTADPITGNLVYQNFGIPVRAVMALKNALQTPGITARQRTDTMAAFQRQFNVSAAEFLEELN